MQFIVKIEVSVGRFSSTADQRLHESGYAAYSQTTGIGLSSMKTSAQSVRHLALHLTTTRRTGRR